MNSWSHQSPTGETAWARLRASDPQELALQRVGEKGLETEAYQPGALRSRSFRPSFLSVKWANERTIMTGQTDNDNTCVGPRPAGAPLPPSMAPLLMFFPRKHISEHLRFLVSEIRRHVNVPGGQSFHMFRNPAETGAQSLLML